MSKPKSLAIAEALTALPPFPITNMFEFVFLQFSKYFARTAILLKSNSLKH